MVRRAFRELAVTICSNNDLNVKIYLDTHIYCGSCFCNLVGNEDDPNHIFLSNGKIIDIYSENDILALLEFIKEHMNNH